LKRVFCLFLCMAFVFSSLGTVSAKPTEDITNHWASATLQQWIDKGWISGYEDGTIRPDATLTRAEFAALINRVFLLTEKADKLAFVDLTDKHWAYEDIAVAYKAGYLKGTTGNKVLPNGNTSRQEAAVMLANLLKLELSQDGDLSMLSDSTDIASWARGAVAALAGKDILVDAKGEAFRPKASITRAEAIVAIDAAMKQSEPVAKLFDKPGVYGSAETTETIEGNVVISAEGVTLQNIVITGDLKLTQDIGEGDVSLNRVTVKGTTLVQGGGKNSIHFMDSVLSQILVERLSASVRVVLEGTTTATQLSILSEAVIELIGNAEIDAVKVLEGIPKTAEIILIGSFNIVEAEAGAAAGNIQLTLNASIAKLILHAAFHISGQGTVQLLIVYTEGIVLDKAPAKVEVGDGVSDPVKYTAAGQPRTIFTSTGGFGGGGGGGGGGGPTVPLAPLAIESFEVGTHNNQELKVNFNKTLKTNYSAEGLSLLKAAVTIVDEEGELFAALKEEDIVELSGKTLKIIFPSQFPGKKLRIKITAGAIKDIDGLSFTQDYISSPFSKGISLNDLSNTNLQVGGYILFNVDEPTPVFFMNRDETGIETLEQYYEKVQEGKAKLINAVPGQLNVVDTRGLQPGTYALRIWQGVNVWFNIQASSDQSPPVLTVSETTIDIGDPLFVSMNEMANVYWVPEGTPLDIVSLEAAVASGNGGMEWSYVNSAAYPVSTLRINMQLGKWLVVAADAAGNLSEGITVTVAVAGTSKPNVVSFHPIYNSFIILDFNKDIRTNLYMEELKNAITISNDNGRTYSQLPGDVFVSLGGTNLHLTFANRFTGSDLRIKIDAGAIEDKFGNELAQDYISPAFSAGTVLTPINSIFITEGQKFSFTADREGPVFLTESGQNASSLEGYHELVNQGKATLIDVNASDVNKVIEIDTSRMAKGRYSLTTWQGTSLALYISVTPITFDQFEITNSLTQNDIVTIYDVEAGDIIKVWNSTILYVGSEPERTITVPEGQTSVTLTDLVLNENGGSISVTITKPNLLESDRYGISYYRATDTEVSIPSLFTVTSSVYQGDNIWFQSNQKGTVYFVPSGTEINLEVLNNLSAGTKLEVNKDRAYSIDSSAYSVGEWWLLAVNGNGDISEPYPISIRGVVPVPGEGGAGVGGPSE
jgi:hypothetical protein